MRKSNRKDNLKYKRGWHVAYTPPFLAIKEKQLGNKPKRHNNHIIETKSKKFLESQIPDEWIIGEPRLDYGIDYEIGIVHNNEVTGCSFSIQLKGKQREKDVDYVTVQLKRSTLNYYHVRFEPTLLVIFVIEEEEGFWLWINTNKIDLTSDQNTFRFKIPRSNKLSELNWGEVAKEVDQIFSKKYLIDKLPDINFDTLEKREKTAWRSLILGEFEKATIEFKKLLNDEKRISWLSGLTTCYFELFRYDEALLTINQALELKEGPQILLIKASILAESGKKRGERVRLLKANSIFEEHISPDVIEPLHN